MEFLPVYTPGAHYQDLRTPVIVTARSAWRQKLVDAAHKDLDECKSHLDFLFTITKHSQAWLAEANQWNAIPKGKNKKVWENFRIISPDIRPTLTNGAVIKAKYWFSIVANMQPGDVWMTDFVDVLPFYSAIPMKLSGTEQIVYLYKDVGASGSTQQASSIVVGCELAPYLMHRLALNVPHSSFLDDGSFEKKEPLNYFSDLSDMRSMLLGTVELHTKSWPNTWLGNHMSMITTNIKNAVTLKQIATIVENNLPVFYAAAKGWEYGPASAAQELEMNTYKLELAWKYGNPFTEKAANIKNGQGYTLQAVTSYSKDNDPITALEVLKMIPLAGYLSPDDQRQSFDWPDKSTKTVAMSFSASSLFSQLAVKINEYDMMRDSLGVSHDYRHASYERFMNSDADSAVLPDALNVQL